MRASIVLVLVLVLVLGFAACSGPKIAYLELPPLETAKSAIAAVDTGDGAPRIFAAARETFELVLEAPETERATVTVIGFEQSLTELGLVAGPLASANEGIALASLPRIALVEAAFRDEAWSAWARLQNVPEVLATVRIPLVGCSSIRDVSVERFDGEPSVALAAAIDEEKALLVLGDRAVVWSVAGGIEESADLPIAFGGGHFDRISGRAYLGAAEAPELYTLDPASLAATLFATVTDPDTGVLRWIDGDNVLLMVLSSSGRLFRVEGGNAERVATIDVAGARTDIGAVLALSRDQVFFGADNNPDLHRFDGAAAQVDIEGPVDSKGFVTIEVVPALGPVTVELTSGLIYARPSGQWVEIGRAMQETHVIHPIGPGRFIVADVFARWTEFLPEYPLGCGLNQNEHLVRADAIFQLGPSVFAVGPGAGGAIEIAHIAEVR